MLDIIFSDDSARRTRLALAGPTLKSPAANASRPRLPWRLPPGNGLAPFHVKSL